MRHRRRGAVPRGKALRRDGARAGDAIYVSGRLGGSALGLATGSGSAWKRHVRPEPRLALGRFLRGIASAAMDLSDGLSLDLRRLAAASGVAAEIEAPPRFPGATLEQSLHGGEDYELLFTAPPRAVPESFEGIPLTRIGTMRKGRPGAVDTRRRAASAARVRPPQTAMILPDPAPVFDLIEAFRRSKTMFAAVSLGIFDRLHEAPATASALAAALGTHAEATARLLDGCAALGFVTKQDGVYANTPVADALPLQRESALAARLHPLLRRSALPDVGASRRRRPRRLAPLEVRPSDSTAPMFSHFFRTEDSMREFLLGMHGFGMLTSPDVVAAFDLSRFRRLVDLGGATGHLAIAACERYPDLRATVFDLPAVVPSAQE